MSQDYESRGYLLDDYRLFHLSEPQKSRVDFHYHEFCKLLLLVSGSGGYSVEGQRYQLQSGDVVLVGSRAVHRPEFQPDAPYERIIVYIDPEFLRRASTPDCDLTELFSGVHGHVLRPENSQKLLSLAQSLEKALSGPEYGRVILSSSALLRLLIHIGMQQRQSPSRQPEPIRPQNERIQQLLRYIDAHIAEDLSIDALSEQCYLSKYHMMRLFRAETDQSVYGYITHRRLVLARQMISRGMAATEAAFRCGFGSYSSFTRSYSKQFGTTPTGRHPSAKQLEETYE